MSSGCKRENCERRGNDMADVEHYADELMRVSKLAKELVNAISGACGGSFQWGVDEIAKSYKSMFDRFCPYNVGDRVELTRTPSAALDPTSGWYQSRHFLKEGSHGTVMGRGYSGNNFAFDVMFDDESWMDAKGIIHPMEPEHKHVYRIYDEQLRLEDPGAP